MSSKISTDCPDAITTDLPYNKGINIAVNEASKVKDKCTKLPPLFFDPDSTYRVLLFTR